MIIFRLLETNFLLFLIFFYLNEYITDMPLGEGMDRKSERDRFKLLGDRKRFWNPRLLLPWNSH